MIYYAIVRGRFQLRVVLPYFFKGKMMVLNTIIYVLNKHNQRKKGIIVISTQREETEWSIKVNSSRPKLILKQ